MKYQLGLFPDIMDELCVEDNSISPVALSDRGISGGISGENFPRSNPIELTDRGRAPLVPLSGAEAVASINSIGSSPNWGTLRAELEKMKDVVAELSSEQREIEDILIEPNGQRKAAEAAIMRTHGDGRAYDFSPDTKARRIEEYNLLLSLAIRYGPLRSRRRDLMAMIKRCGRDIDKLEQIVERKQKEKSHG